MSQRRFRGSWEQGRVCGVDWKGEKAEADWLGNESRGSLGARETEEPGQGCS